jgi:hypothetical protein
MSGAREHPGHPLSKLIFCTEPLGEQLYRCFCPTRRRLARKICPRATRFANSDRPVLINALLVICDIDKCIIAKALA